MTRAAAISTFLGEKPCPVCNNPTDWKTDKKGKVYVFCRNYRTDARGVIFVCGFHLKYGSHDSAELVRALIGGPPANVNGPPTGSGGNDAAPAPEFDQTDTSEGTTDEPEPPRDPGGNAAPEARPATDPETDDEGGLFGG